MQASVRVGFALTGSFCTFQKVLVQMEKLCEEGYDLLPIMSFNAANMDTRFGTSQSFKQRIEEICQKKVIETIQQAEPIGPKGLTDVLVIAPCTGNSLGKLANGVFDTPALMAAKSHLRNQRPLVLAVSTNDALGLSAKNIGALMNMRHVYFVPMRQDDAKGKPRSIVADFSLLGQTVRLAMENRQLQPVYL